MITMALVLMSGATAISVTDPVAETPPPVITHEITYTADLTGVVAGGPSRSGRYLDNLLIDVGADLDRLWGWQGARFHSVILANHGGHPNDVAGTLQGIDNIEVGDNGVRLFEFWIEQDLGTSGGSVLAGLYDVNSEFYATEASGLLISPQFGIGSELSATGPNGPSIFPSSGLAVRARFGRQDGTHLQVAAVNAIASTLGDPDGVDTGFEQGVLLIAEAGWTGRARLAGGVWRYSEDQPDIRQTGPMGEPVGSTAEGAYVLLEAPLQVDGPGQDTHLFLRAGVSDGDTTDFQGSWQAGLHIDRILPSRPDSAFAIGIHQGLLSDSARANIRDTGARDAAAEQGIEITYSDRFGPVVIQPDLQIIQGAGGDRSADTLVVAAVRFSVVFP